MRATSFRLGRPLVSDLLLPVALVLWFIGTQRAQPAAMDDFGLLPALPIVFFIAAGLLIASIVATVLRPELSPLRLALHLGALILILHGTIPLIFSEPIYPWVYKHVGVVGHINHRGSLDTGADIYHDWPGFFALGAWFSRIAGVGGPLDFAAWAPVYFNLVFCLQLGFVFRMLPVTQRARWIGLFLFVVGNWVGQDYFAPQAAAFVLSLAVIGMVLAWLQVARPPAMVRVGRRMASWLGRGRPGNSDAEGGPPAPAPPRPAVRAAVFVVFAALVVTHQLSPYVILLGVGLLTFTGLVRPKWVMVVMAVMAVVYLALHQTYVGEPTGLFSLGNPFANLINTKPDAAVVMTGRRLTALAAPALILCLWMLAMLGAVRRLRAGRPIIVLALLAFAPSLIALGQSYGGEAIFRIYLFSLPWIALLGGSALEPRFLRRPAFPAIKIAVVLGAAAALFMSASFGAAVLNVVRPGEVQASRYFYDNAAPGSALTLIASNFPTRVGDRYTEFVSAGDNPPDLLTSDEGLRYRTLGDADLPAISRFVQESGGGSEGDLYLVLSTGQQVFAEVLGLLPRGSLDNLDRSMARSDEWRIFHRNPDAVIYRFMPDGADAPAVPPVEMGGPAAAGRAGDRSLDPIGLGIGLYGLCVVAIVVRRRHATAVNFVEAAVPEAASPVVEVFPVTAPPELVISPRPRVADLVAALRDDPDPAVRREAARVLADVGSDSALRSLLGALEDSEADVRHLAMEALIQRGSAGIARILASVLTTSTLDSVGEVLLGMGALADDALSNAVVEGPPARASAATTLLIMTGGTTRLVENLGAADPIIRRSAAAALGALSGPDALEGLIAAHANGVPANGVPAKRVPASVA